MALKLIVRIVGVLIVILKTNYCVTDPVVTIYPRDPVVNVGDSVKLKCEVEYDPNVVTVRAIEWQVLSKPIADTNDLVIEDGKAYKKYEIGEVTDNTWKSYKCVVYFNEPIEPLERPVILLVRFPPTGPPECRIPEVKVICESGEAEVLLSCEMDNAGDPGAEATFYLSGREKVPRHKVKLHYLKDFSRWSTIIDFNDYHPGSILCEVVNSYWQFNQTCIFSAIPYIEVQTMVQPTYLPHTSPANTYPPSTSQSPFVCDDSVGCQVAKWFAGIFTTLFFIVIAIFIYRLRVNAVKENRSKWDYFLYWVLDRQT